MIKHEHDEGREDGFLLLFPCLLPRTEPVVIFPYAPSCPLFMDVARLPPSDTASVLRCHFYGFPWRLRIDPRRMMKRPIDSTVGFRRC